MVLMNAPKRVRNVQSLTNQTKNYGIMGGLVPSVARSPSNQAAIRNRAANNIKIPHPGLGPAPSGCPGASEAIAYMMGCSAAGNTTGRYMLSRNPACSGGVGRKPVFVCNTSRA